MEVLCFLGVWESVGAELFDAFTAVAFLVCVSVLVVCHLMNWQASTGRWRRYVAGVVGAEEQHGMGDIHRLDPGGAATTAKSATVPLTPAPRRRHRSSSIRPDFILHKSFVYHK